MLMSVHFVDVGQGNMTLIDADDLSVVLYDCNVTDDNEDRVLRYLYSVLVGRRIRAFINSHRDADHMRGVRKIHNTFGIDSIWDSGVPGGSPDSLEYRDYMQLRREIGHGELEPGTRYALGQGYFWVLGARVPGSTDVNTQSAVVKAGYSRCSVMLPGDSDASAWERLCLQYGVFDLDCTALLASHHGALGFFEGPGDSLLASLLRGAAGPRPPLMGLGALAALARRLPPPSALPTPPIRLPPPPRPSSTLPEPPRRRRPTPVPYFTTHLERIRPYVTVVSVGPNTHGHPSPVALSLYERFTQDPPVATLPRVCRTDVYGTLRLDLWSDGSWRIQTVGV